MKKFFFIWDRTNNRLLDSQGNVLSPSFFNWYRGDVYLLCLTAKVFNTTTNAWDEENLPATSTFQLMVKLGRFEAEGQDGTEQLAFTDTDGFNDGSWAEATAGSAKLSAILDLTETTLEALLAEDDTPLTPILEITETVTGGDEATLQQQVTIYPDMNRGGSTGITVPTYYTAAQVDAAIAAALVQYLRKDSFGNTWAVKNGEPVANLTGQETEYTNP